MGDTYGEECSLPATVCADEYFSLFSKGASRLDQLKPQLAPARAAQRGRRFDEGTHVISSRFRAGRTRWNFLNVYEGSHRTRGGAPASPSFPHRATVARGAMVLRVIGVVPLLFLLVRI